jgi:hypothetical protein
MEQFSHKKIWSVFGGTNLTATLHQDFSETMPTFTITHKMVNKVVRELNKAQPKV